MTYRVKDPVVHVKSSVDYESTQITEEITQHALKVLKMDAVRKRNVRSDRRQHVCVLRKRTLGRIVGNTCACSERGR